MRVRILFASLLLAAAAAPATVLAGPDRVDSRAPAPRLRGAQCLDPEAARGFVELDDHRSILVDAGRYHYRIEVSGACWNLDHASIIAFRGDPVSNRVCGGAFDAVLVSGGHPCQIGRMELLDKDEYQLALKQRQMARRARRAERRARSS